ncbi:MAG: hypothetical protein QM619_11700 [Micropruina sp.]|uniref:hypothetical protein n=1 Tax=Micropruina sp. TaxID=2737536 RepID=UPI0039E5E019
MTGPDAPALGHLLHKHPDRVQTFTLPVGAATVFYPESLPAWTTCWRHGGFDRLNQRWTCRSVPPVGRGRLSLVECVGTSETTRC